MSTAELEPVRHSGMSLYRIDETLTQLIGLREEMAQDDPPATEDELAIVDQQIREYMLVELPRKVTSTCAIFRMWKGERALMKAERERIHSLEKALEAREERLKAYVAEVLEKQPMPAKGCRKLEGADGSKLMLKGNGGVQPLSVTAELLPAEYFDVIVRMTESEWLALRHSNGMLAGDVIAREPSNPRIREALAQPCGNCGGVGEHASPAGSKLDKWPCATCGGTGKQGVPGASLGERGAHVEIR